ncbi:MAG TPA: Slp/YeaY family lipoprotein [Rhodanobacteraceae bacterium]|nr:Slp/YeaY family lipoprotein [Rhodanobacteraceae bacterium]
MWKLLMLAAASLLLAACATVPERLTGQYASVPPNQAAEASGAHVRWGGTILKTVPESHQTCIYAMARPLSATTRPYAEGNEGGRFVACHAGFYDPQVYAPGRAITVTGSIDGSRKVGNYGYPYPRLQANVIHLWPQREDRPTPLYRNDPDYLCYDSDTWKPGGWGPRVCRAMPSRAAGDAQASLP